MRAGLLLGLRAALRVVSAAPARPSSPGAQPAARLATQQAGAQRPLLEHAGEKLLAAPPKQIALSGPSGFVGNRVRKDFDSLSLPSRG